MSGGKLVDFGDAHYSGSFGPSFVAGASDLWHGVWVVDALGLIDDDGAANVGQLPAGFHLNRDIVGAAAN